MAYTITDNNNNPITLDPVISEESTKDSGLFFMPLPASDSSSALMIDIFGATRTFSLAGTFVGSSTTDVSNFLTSLDGLANGSQNQKTYHSDKSNTNYSVLVTSIKWTSEPGAVLKIDWQLELQEGSA
jgi:hypothetical protein